MKIFTYRVARDFGFAPNPFNGFCTLATCKPKIRNSAQVGDWVLGLGTKSLKCRDFLIYAMRVNEKVSFDEYWNDERFQCKKSSPNGSLKTMYGDNIYHHNGKKWIQSNSHHSRKNGKTHRKNLKKDTASNHVLISEQFYYIGDARLVKIYEVSRSFYNKVKGRYVRQKNFEDKEASKIIGQLKNTLANKNISKGFCGDPVNWTQNCPSRYMGK